jgi:hypothetical protein
MLDGMTILESIFLPQIEGACLFKEISHNYVDLYKLVYKFCLNPFISGEYSSMAKFMAELVTLAPNLLFRTKSYKVIRSLNV